MRYENDDKSEKKSIGLRPDEGEMSDDELRSIMGSLIDDATDYVDNTLSPERVQATKYYNAEKFGNEEEGRSQVILTEVRDAVRGVMPGLLKVFHGPEHTVEFVPNTMAAVEAAAQATDYVRYVFEEDNAGFMLTHSVLKDALVRKTGIFMWGWDESENTKTFQVEGVDEQQLQLLATDDSLKFTRIDEMPADPALAGAIGPDGIQPPPPKMYSAEFTRVEKDGRARVYALPPEEFLLSREATSLDDALFVGRRTEMTRGDLIALGIPAKVIDEHGGPGSQLETNMERVERSDTGVTRDAEAGEANDKILYIEGYPRIDRNGDGKSELLKVCTIGPAYHVVKVDTISDRPFAVFTPDPEPHKVVGLSLADSTMDMQKTKSAVFRSILDSLSGSIFARTAYVEGQVNVQDILNTAIGAPIRMKAPGMVQPFEMPFVGQQAFPVMEYLDEVVERRTGRNKGTMGLDADALQSSTQSAVGAAISASQEQSEMLARIFAETLKRVFKGLLRLLVEHQPRARVVRLRQQWVSVDPRSWNADMDVTVNVALGSGMREEKVQTLLGIKQGQEYVLTTMGPSNPLVSLDQYSNTLSDIIALQGRKNTQRYFNTLPKGFQLPPTPPAPDPAQMLAQLEIQKAQIAAQQKQQEFAMRTQEHENDMAMRAAQAAQKMDFDREKLATETEMQRLTLELQYKTAIDTASINAAISRERASQELDIREFEAASAAERDGAKAALEHDRGVREMELAHQRENLESEREHQREREKIHVEAAKSAEPKEKAEPAAPAPVIHVHTNGGPKKITFTKSDGKQMKAEVTDGSEGEE